MKASELIQQLNHLIAQSGDLDVEVKDHVEGNDYSMTTVTVQPTYQCGSFKNDKGEEEPIFHPAVMLIQ